MTNINALVRDGFERLWKLLSAREMSKTCFNNIIVQYLFYLSYLIWQYFQNLVQKSIGTLRFQQRLKLLFKDYFSFFIVYLMVFKIKLRTIGKNIFVCFLYCLKHWILRLRNIWHHQSFSIWHHNKLLEFFLASSNLLDLASWSAE